MSNARIRKICADYGVAVRPYSDPAIAGLIEDLSLPTDTAGFAVSLNNSNAILYDDSRSETEIRYTLAHELGHILLGHLSYRDDIGKYPEHMETEANIFASVIMTGDILCTLLEVKQ